MGKIPSGPNIGVVATGCPFIDSLKQCHHHRHRREASAWRRGPGERARTRRVVHAEERRDPLRLL